MKLPSDVVIAEEKLTQYLLVWRARNDKSAFLAQAGYELSNVRIAISAIPVLTLSVRLAL